jgi:hypothetical protein
MLFRLDGGNYIYIRNGLGIISFQIHCHIIASDLKAHNHVSTCLV